MRFVAWSPRSVQDDSSFEPSVVHIESKRQDSCLPSEILTKAPSCADQCIQTWILKNHNSVTCSESQSLNFLCTTKSDSEFTIGEGAVQCVLQSCTNPTESQLDVYNVCKGIPNSLPKLQSTITATVPVTSATGESSTLTDASTDVVIATVTSNNGGLAIDTSTPPTFNPGDFVATNIPYPRPTASQPSVSSGMTRPAQIAGVAVGSAAGVFGLLGVMLFFCRRRRKAQKDQTSRNLLRSGEPVSLSSSANTSRGSTPFPKIEGDLSRHYTNPSPESISAAVEAAAAGVPNAAILASGIRSKPRSFLRQDIDPKEIGVAVSPTEGDGPWSRSQNINAKQLHASMMPIPESGVLPSVPYMMAPGDDASQRMGERTSDATTASMEPGMKGLRSIPIYSIDEKRHYSYEDVPVDSDVEAQGEPLMPGHSSVLGSARTSLASLATSLARSLSIKRGTSSLKAAAKAGEKVNKNQYSLTPKYDNGNFVVNAPLATSITSPAATAQISPAQNMNIPRKPTFSSFVAGKLLPSSAFRSPTTNFGGSVIPPVPLFQGRQALSPNDAATMQNANHRGTDNSMSSLQSGDWRAPMPQAFANGKSPGMLPKPLTIRKSKSRETTKSGHSKSPSRDLHYPLGSLAGQMSDPRSAEIIAQAPQKVRELMGLGDPANVQQYARKPLPAPISTHNPFANLMPQSNVNANRLSSVNTLAAVKAAQHEHEDIDAEDDMTEPPLSAATSWLSVPVSTPGGALRSTIIASPYRPMRADSIKSPGLGYPRGDPAFPSAASFSSIYTKYKHSMVGAPGASPNSTYTLSAVTYKPPSPPPPMPKLALPSSSNLTVTPVSAAANTDSGKRSAASSIKDGEDSGIHSNISTPVRFTKNINPYNPYFPPSPAVRPRSRSRSSSSSRGSQSMALSSHPPPMPDTRSAFIPGQNGTPAIPASNGLMPNGDSQSLRPTSSGRPFGRTSEAFSPDSADPMRPSIDFSKVKLTPNKTLDGDLVIMVDKTGKGYGV